MCFKTLNAVCAQHKPDLQSAETASEWDLPVSIVGYEAGVGEWIAEEGGRYGESVG